ncbi:MAG TPA: hypothetical protein VIX37_07745, partial [Candidatus Sulfotelmatobacter sp.]
TIFANRIHHRLTIARKADERPCALALEFYRFSKLSQQAQQWLFEPYLKNGERVNVRLNTTVRVNVIKPR